MTRHAKQVVLERQRDSLQPEPQSADAAGRASAVTRLDGEIKAMCTHDSICWNSRTAEDGGIITTCERCEMSWHEHVG